MELFHKTKLKRKKSQTITTPYCATIKRKSLYFDMRQWSENIDMQNAYAGAEWIMDKISSVASRPHT